MSMGSLYSNEFLSIRMYSEKIFILLRLYIKNKAFPHDYSLVMRELCLISLADMRVNANIEFMNKLINDRIDAPSFLSSVNFKVSSHITRHHVPFVVPVQTTNYGNNNPLHRIMRLVNESIIYQD
jgi:hypothetical protein